jgi:putative transposase
MTSPVSLQHGCIYHIYNRGINRENIFLEERSYAYFLKLYTKYITPVAFTYAYCLLRNHFHFLVQIKTPEEIARDENLTGLGDLSGFIDKPPSKIFSNFFNAYAKAINKEYGRSGSLFQRPFGRVEVSSDRHLVQLVTYIHQNPVKHRFVDDLRAWPYSSFGAILSSRPTRVERKVILDWFSGREQFAAAHEQSVAEKEIAWLIGNDLD